MKRTKELNKPISERINIPKKKALRSQLISSHSLLGEKHTSTIWATNSKVKVMMEGEETSRKEIRLEIDRAIEYLRQNISHFALKKSEHVFDLVIYTKKPRIFKTDPSSDGRAEDCSMIILNSLGHWFDSGGSDIFFF